LADVQWDQAAWQAWLRDPAGPVMTDLLPRLGARCTALAQAKYHRRTGVTADSIHYKVDSDSQGPFCDVGGSYVITFLEHPASQMHMPYRWLSDAVGEIAAGGA
jgi:hypothetical protein